MEIQALDVSNMTDKECRYYNDGLPTPIYFNILLNIMKPFIQPNQSTISPSKTLLLTLTKLRLGLDFRDLGFRHKIGETSASRLFYKCINLLYWKLKPLIKIQIKQNYKGQCLSVFNDVLAVRCHS